MSDSLYDPPFRPAPPDQPLVAPEAVGAVFAARLSGWQKQAVAAGIAAAQNLPLYVVGGGVRDVLLNRAATLDLDLVVEGNAHMVAGAVYGALGGDVAGLKLLEHAAFGTATITAPDGQHLDIASARRESYAHPAALPTVSFPASLRDDLHRRDFSINTLALSLTAAPPDGIIDRFGGVADVRAGLIRVLHPASFVDDPTRLYRAARFAGRFGYRFAPQTRELMAAAIAGGAVAGLTAERLRNELRAILREAEPDAALALCHRLGLLAAIDPRLVWDTTLGDDLAGLRDAAARADSAGSPRWLTTAQAWVEVGDAELSIRDIPRWQAALAALVYRLPPDAAAALLLDRLRFAHDDARPAIETARLFATVPPAISHIGPQANSAVVALFAGISEAGLRLFTVLAARQDVWAARAALFYTFVLSKVQPALRGGDLVRLGVPSGPAVGRTIARLRAAKYDHLNARRADEETWVRGWVLAGDL